MELDSNLDDQTTLEPPVYTLNQEYNILLPKLTVAVLDWSADQLPRLPMMVFSIVLVHLIYYLKSFDRVNDP